MILLNESVGLKNIVSKRLSIMLVQCDEPVCLQNVARRLSHLLKSLKTLHLKTFQLTGPPRTK